jgi:hypothetical protein
VLSLSQAKKAVADLVKGNEPKGQITSEQMDVWQSWFTPLAVLFAEKFTDWEQVEDHFTETAAAFRDAFELRWDVVAKHFYQKTDDQASLWSYMAFYWLFHCLKEEVLTAQTAKSPDALTIFLDWQKSQAEDQ